MIAMLRRAVSFGALLVLATPALPAGAATVSTGTSPIVARTSPGYVSFAVDLDQITGGMFWSQAPNARGNAPVAPYDFTRARLRILAQGLAPAYLRISGTAANKTYYDLSATPVTTPPGAYQRILTRAEWDSVGAFARTLALKLVLGINAGPGPRDAAGSWVPDNARALLSYTASHGFPLTAVEFGNEPNLFSLVSGLPAGYSTADYLRDLQTFERAAPSSRSRRAAARAWKLLQQRRERDALWHRIWPARQSDHACGAGHL